MSAKYERQHLPNGGLATMSLGRPKCGLTINSTGNQRVGTCSLSLRPPEVGITPFPYGGHRGRMVVSVLNNGENYHLSFWISSHTQWRAWRTQVARPCYYRVWAGHKRGLSWCSWFMRIMLHLPCTLSFSPGVYAETHVHRTTAGQWVFRITHLLMFQSTSSRDIPSTFSWRGKKRNRFLKFQVSENICLLTLLCSPRDDPGIREHSRVGGGFGKVTGILVPERKIPAKDLGYTPRANRLDRKRLWCCYLTFKRVDMKGLITFLHKLLLSEGWRMCEVTGPQGNYVKGEEKGPRSKLESHGSTLTSGSAG